MFEKVNPCHPDKVADRIAGAIVDLAYAVEDDPKIAVEVLIGHGKCHAIIETTAALDTQAIFNAIRRIAGSVEADVVIVPQDAHLSRNQANGLRCGDNGIFKGVPVTDEQRTLSKIARLVYQYFPHDGKYILNGSRLIFCLDRGYDWNGLYEYFKRVSCWCCPLQSLPELRQFYKHPPVLWAKLKEWDSQTWRKFRADYSVEELETRFVLENERLADGLPIKGKAFFDALKARLEVAANELAR